MKNINIYLYIISLIQFFIIRYLEEYIIKLENNDDAAPPNVENLEKSVNHSIMENLKTAKGDDQNSANVEEIKNSISFLG